MNTSSALLLIYALTTVANASVPASVEVAASHFEDANASASGRVLSPVGLFPIWENTGTVLRHGQIYVGSQLIGFGLVDRLQVGTHPIRDAMHTPNLHAKLLLLDEPQLQVAAHAELMWMIEGASESFTVSNFASRLSTGDGIWVAPLGVTATLAPTRNVFLHVTTTAQGVASKALPAAQVTLGVSGQLEWRVFQHHAISVHAAQVGLLQPDYTQVAASYRYQRWIFEGSLGYARRIYRDGGQGFPIAALGVEL